MLPIYYIADVVSQVKQFLADFFSVCGVIKIFDDNSLRSFLFELICVVEYIVFLEVLDEVSVCFRCRTIEFDNVVCQKFCAILFILCYVSYTFYHFSIIDNSVDEDGWRF
jgi:hypothetical protein